MSSTKFWTENMKCIFDDYQIIPYKNMCIEQKLNTLTKFVFLVFLILVSLDIFELKNSIIFLLISLLFIINLYYNQKTIMIKENFEMNDNDFSYKTARNTYCVPYSARVNYNCSKKSSKIEYAAPKDETPYMSDKPNYNHGSYNANFKTKSDNQALVGNPNPKTLRAPVLAAPLADLDYWKSDKDLSISIINDKKKRYNEESGYITSGYIPTSYAKPNNYTCGYKKSRKPVEDIRRKPPAVEKEEIKESFSFPYEIDTGKHEQLNEPDYLFNTQFKKNDMFKDKYNENVFTQTIQPSVYRVNNRNEPINSNIGISHVQEFEPDTTDIIEPVESVNRSNTYDPRFYGYGPNYRGYIDKGLGQQRFYYDDVDSVKMPNYITRNHLDVFSFGDSSGALEDDGNKYTSNIHELANNHYMDSQNQFRVEMQERLMRKKNAEQWQRKMYPIHTQF